MEGNPKHQRMDVYASSSFQSSTRNNNNSSEITPNENRANCSQNIRTEPVASPQSPIALGKSCEERPFSYETIEANQSSHSIATNTSIPMNNHNIGVIALPSSLTGSGGEGRIPNRHIGNRSQSIPTSTDRSSSPSYQVRKSINRRNNYHQPRIDFRPATDIRSTTDPQLYETLESVCSSGFDSALVVNTTEPNSRTITPETDGRYLALQWNINGIRNQLGDLQIIVNKHNPVCIAIQETHLHNGHNINNWISGKYVWQTTRGNNIYQTIGLGIRTDCPYQPVILDTNLLAIAARISIPAPITVVSIYLQRNGINNLEQKLNHLIKQLDKPFLILGDVNAHHPEWGSAKCDGRGNIVHNVLQENDCIVLNDESYTYVKGTYTSAIDLSVASSEIVPKLSWLKLKDTMGSDHFPILIGHSDKAPETTRRPSWRYQAADWESFQATIIKELQNDHIYSPSEFEDLIFQSATENIPRTSGKPSVRALHWYNKDIGVAAKARKKALRRLCKLKKRNERSPETEQAKKYFIEAKKICRATIFKAKTKSWEEFLDGIDSRLSTTELWRRVNALQGKRRQRGIALQLANSTVTDDPAIIAEELGQYFRSLSDDQNYHPRFLRTKMLSESVPTTFVINSHEDESKLLSFNKRITLNELTYALATCNGKSAGPDQIGYPLIQHLPPEGKRALLDMYNQVWIDGKYPKEWQCSTVIPIPKPGKKMNSPSDFRPISLTNCMGKVMEKIVNRRLSQTLEDKDLLDWRQFAFRQGKGTGMYLATLGEIIDQARERNEHCDIAVLDLSKAYNRVWKEGVLKKLNEWGFSGRIGKFIQGFLQDRSFRVAIGGTLSQSFSERNGVPQGSVLAVTLFLIAVNSIFESLPNGIHILLYADDIVIVVTGPNATRVRIKIRSAIRHVFKWTERTGFSIAPEKCSITHCCDHHHHPWKRIVKINGTTIPFKNHVKIIGVTIDRRMSFIKHFQIVKKDVTSRRRLIKTITGRHTNANRRTIINVGNAILTSRLCYGIELTCRNPDSFKSILAPVYNDMIRNASGLLPSSPALPSCIEAGVLPFDAVVAKTAARRIVGYAEKTTGTESCTITAVENLFRSFTGNNLPKIARLHQTRARKWDVRAPTIDVEMTKLVKAGSPSEIVKQLFLNLINNKYQQHKHVYTDGSLTNGKIGFGIYETSNESFHSLPPQCTVFSAEAAAIAVALKNQSTTIPVVIFTDSLSVLMAIEKGKTLHPFLQLIEMLCGQNITLCWIPGHCGISGNIKADKLASLGCNVIAPYFQEVPGSDVRNFITESINEKVARLWHSNQQHMRKIKLELGIWNDRESYREQRVLSRLRVGHTRLSHAHVITSTPPPMCEACDVRNTVEHILLNCDKYADLRENYNIPLSIKDALSNDSNQEQILINFLKDARIYNEM